VFVPKIPSTRIIDLARVIAPDSAVEVVGIRPGEKLHEVLIHEDEARSAVELEDMYVVLPTAAEIGFARECRQAWQDKGQSLPDGFRYGSESNPQWLTVEQMQAIVAPFEVAAQAEPVGSPGKLA
jgi:UDP-N-acetylglucosamine 4,6-dehydratase